VLTPPGPEGSNGSIDPVVGKGEQEVTLFTLTRPGDYVSIINLFYFSQLMADFR